jgi:hypothetical protein
VNLKSVSDSGLFANAAARRGSPLAGVKDEIGLKLTAIAGARFLVGVGLLVANAGDSTRPAAAMAVTSLAVFDPRAVNKANNSLFTSRYSHSHLKVP